MEVLHEFVDASLLNSCAVRVLQTACGHLCEDTDTLWAVLRTKLQLNKREIMLPAFIIHRRIPFILNLICRHANDHLVPPYPFIRRPPRLSLCTSVPLSSPARLVTQCDPLDCKSGNIKQSIITKKHQAYRNLARPPLPSQRPTV